MKKTAIIIIFSALSFVCNLALGADNAVAHWKFDEGGGTTAYDSAGNNNGTLFNGPVWTTGQIGGALSFDGVDDYVDCGNDSSLKPPLPITISAWVRLSGLGNSQYIVALDNQTSKYYGVWFHVRPDNTLVVSYGDGGAPAAANRRSKIGTTALSADTWYHVAVVIKGAIDMNLYIDGADDGGTYRGSGASLAYSSGSLLIGNKHDSAYPFDGIIDDVRVYKRPLSEEEIKDLYKGLLDKKASVPNPADGAAGVDLDVVLSFSPGENATSHDVYFGTDYNDVNDADASSAEYKGNFDVNYWDPCGLELSTTYYWRIDEIIDSNLWKGYIWSFKTTNEDGQLHVPSEYSTIQGAVDSAFDGDVVIVADGTYTGPGNRDIDFLGKAITVRSENGPENCIIDCENAGDGFALHNNEGADSVLDGFSITNGYGGISCYNNSSPTIANCIIMGNTDSGIRCSDGAGPIITNCRITGNSADWGGGICGEGDSLTVTNCTITGNTAEDGCGAIDYYGYSVVTITNCIIWDNVAPSGAGVEIYGIANVTYNNIQNGYRGEGNISIDPLLTPDGHLQPGSPCIDAGDPDFLPQLGQVDIDGQPRIMSGRVDMGVDEADGPLTSAIVLSSRKFNFNANVGGPNPAPQVLSVRNILQDTLNWQVTEDCPWLQVHPLTGSSTYEPNYVTLSVDITGLVSGVYNCILTVSEPNAANSPRTVSVTLGVYAPELLVVPAEYPTIQSAIDAAVNGDTVVVTPGTYFGEGNRYISFLGKAITVRSVDPTDPLIVDDTVVNCSGGSGGDGCGGFNFRNDEDANSILSGITITGARCAICCYDSSPTIKNCNITGNYNYGYYGAIRCSGSPTIADCTITDNFGSGIYCSWGCPKITDCFIARNAGWDELDGGWGGGIYCDNSQMIITNCTITEHTICQCGGGILAESSNLIIKNCTIAGNTAGRDGAGIFWGGDYDGYGEDNLIVSEITGCTIADNSAGDNGGGIFFSSSARPAPVTNSIVWGNSDSSGSGQDAQIYSNYGSPRVWFSCIQDDNPNDVDVPFGEEQFNIDDDPCFVEADGDYHLLADSPCIEAGDPYISFVGETDMDGQPRRMGPRLDMGADEFEITMIVVTKPQGGEVWATGSKHEIKWDSYGITGTVDIYYSDTNGADWVMIDNAPDTGSYFWHLPQMVNSDQCIIAVEPNVIPPGLILIESRPFTIHPYWHWPLPPPWPGHHKMKSGPRYGCVKWKFQTDGPVTAGVAGGYNRVYVPCEGGKLYALNAFGRLVWTYDTNSPLIGSPAVSRNGAVYVGAENGKLYAIGKWGRLLWTHTTDKPIYSSPTVSANGDIYVCSLDGKLYALAPDGSELWSFETGGISPAAGGAIFASPAIDPNGTVYIAGICDPNLYALDSNDGTVKWSLRFSDLYEMTSMHRQPWPLASPVIADDGVIYQTLLYDPNLYAIDPNDGQLIWSTHLADPCSGWFEPNYINQHTYWDDYPPPYLTNFNRYASSWSKPALAPDGTVYVSFDDPYLRAVDLDGNIKWVTRLGMMGGFTLTVGGNGLIYAACDDGTLYVVDPNGREISRFEGSGGLSFPTIMPRRTVIVSDSDNTIWAISPYRCWARPLALHRPEDLNGDRTVNITDFAVLAAGWLDRTDTCWPCGFEEYPVYPEGDIDKSLYTDFADLAQLANQWLN